MAIRKVEPDEAEKMQDDCEYLKVIIDEKSSVSTLIYYDKTSHREEVIEGRCDLYSLTKEGWEHVYSNLEHYFERLTPEGLQHKKDEDEKARQALIDARTPPKDLRHFADPLRPDTIRPDAEYVQVVWYRDTNSSTIHYFNSDKSRKEKRSVRDLGRLEQEFIRKGYYVKSRGGGREGAIMNFIKYRKLPKDLKP